MRFSKSRIGATTVLALFVTASTGCTLINKLRAKSELNDSAQAYKEGHIEEAEQHAKKALYYDPDNMTARIFIARVIHQQYKQGVDTPDNKAKAQEAIEAYKQILQKDPSNEEAYKAISVLYAFTKDEQNLRDWIMARANDSSMSPEKRAEAYAILAGKDWDCSFKITELPDVKQTATEGGAAKVTYKKPKEQKDFDKIQHCVVQGLQEAETAIKFDANNDSAWSYKTNLLIESAKIAKMNGDETQAAGFQRQADAAQKRATALAEERRKKEEAAQATPAPK
jgi:tetratricopeptide (TPR) repeat protein